MNISMMQFAIGAVVVAALYLCETLRGQKPTASFVGPLLPPGFTAPAQSVDPVGFSAKIRAHVDQETDRILMQRLAAAEADRRIADLTQATPSPKA